MHASNPTRRRLLQLLATGSTTTLAIPLWAASSNQAITLEIWKDPSCGCCRDWIAHMEESGFKATVHDTGNNAARARLGLARQYGSCHTALIEGYVIEGHVRVADIRRLLRERPQALGLAVPGMPVGSPGMDGPAYGDRHDPYDTLLVLRDGGNRVFESHR